ncbi:hypothetical protein [Nocardia sp. NPDC050718]|uniref:hypothetical protein n=1 Tax=Nocardia sp. NPDC050718 TaxID=3155788 RepID=UPI0033F858F2
MTRTIEFAQRPASSGDDRLIVTDDAVIVLDGATVHDPTMPSAGEYVDRLGSELAKSIAQGTELVDVLEGSLARTVEALGIQPGLAPSSTVALVRFGSETVEGLILGDSSVIVGLRDGTVIGHTDDRLSRLRLPEADLYRRFLSEGQGFSGRHRKVLQELQLAERAQRNQPGGYWIAEADPVAAKHALHMRYTVDEVLWVITATDGVVDLAPTLGVGWSEVAEMSTVELDRFLDRIHTWEAETDPNGLVLPRSKRHDDKTVAVVRLHAEPSATHTANRGGK